MTSAISEMTTVAGKFRSAEKSFVLGYVQPGLVGLIDGTLSTLAPIFAAALLAARVRPCSSGWSPH
jgi:hypothetical protein